MSRTADLEIIRSSARRKLVFASVRYIRSHLSLKNTFRCSRGSRLRGPYTGADYADGSLLKCLQDGKYAFVMEESQSAPLVRFLSENRVQAFNVIFTCYAVACILFICRPVSFLEGVRLKYWRHDWHFACKLCHPVVCHLVPGISFGLSLCRCGEQHYWRIRIARWQPWVGEEKTQQPLICCCRQQCNVLDSHPEFFSSM